MNKKIVMAIIVVAGMVGTNAAAMMESLRKPTVALVNPKTTKSRNLMPVAPTKGELTYGHVHAPIPAGLKGNFKERCYPVAYQPNTFTLRAFCEDKNKIWQGSKLNIMNKKKNPDCKGENSIVRIDDKGHMYCAKR